MTNHAPIRRHVLAATLVALATLPAFAAAPYAVRRAGSAAEVATGDVVGWSATGVWDDVTVDLDDGLDWFYVVEDASGSTVPVRLERNDALRCVRIVVEPAIPGPNARAEAVATLEGLAEAVERIASVSGPETGAWLLAGLDELDAALATLGDAEGARDNLALKRDLDLALRDLLAAREAATTEAGAIDAVIEVLLASTRELARHHVAAAEAACGMPAAEARKALDEGDAARDAGDPIAAVDAWARAIERSWQAAQRCG